MLPEGFAAGRACCRTLTTPSTGSSWSIGLLPIEGATACRRRPEEPCMPPFALANYALRGGCSNLGWSAARCCRWSRCMRVVLQTRSRRETRAARAVFEWSLRRWLLCEACTSCGLYGSRITLALGTLRGFIVHMDALDGPAKWLGLWHCWRRANSALVEAVKRPLGRPRVCPL